LGEREFGTVPGEGGITSGGKFGSGWEDCWGGGVTETFSFEPLVDANPSLGGNSRLCGKDM
jgi:hypothetical protein